MKGKSIRPNPYQVMLIDIYQSLIGTREKSELILKEKIEAFFQKQKLMKPNQEAQNSEFSSDVDFSDINSLFKSQDAI